MASIKKSLIVGMGIGQLYQTVLKELGHVVYTVDMDPAKKADFTSVEEALDSLIERGNPMTHLDTVHICTPNWTHEGIAYGVAPYSKVVFIEKPGFRTEERWFNLQKVFPATRIMMVKNNMWRDNIDEMQATAEKCEQIYFNWLNYDRVPSPGSWFTTKDSAFGGVSRDLMPHLLSLVVAIFPEQYKNLDLTSNGKERTWNLAELTNTQYGAVNKNGVYNVDDLAWMSFHLLNDKKEPQKLIMLEADWRTMETDERNIVFEFDNEDVTFELGLCPEYAYKNMIKDCLDNLNNTAFWKNQYEIDLWIHRMVNEL